MTHQAPEHFLVVLALSGLEDPRPFFDIRVSMSPDPHSRQTCTSHGGNSALWVQFLREADNTDVDVTSMHIVAMFRERGLRIHCVHSTNCKRIPANTAHWAECISHWYTHVTLIQVLLGCHTQMVPMPMSTTHNLSHAFVMHVTFRHH